MIIVILLLKYKMVSLAYLSGAEMRLLSVEWRMVGTD